MRTTEQGAVIVVGIAAGGQGGGARRVVRGMLTGSRGAVDELAVNGADLVRDQCEMERRCELREDDDPRDGDSRKSKQSA